jgi:DNA-binding beta-propeller fold protein YncE
MRWQMWAVVWPLAVVMAADLNPVALRLVGQLRSFANGVNLAEGRELASPQGLAVDLSSSPLRLYVADTLNNRVLGWRDAGGFANGATADLVIGQPDFFSTSPDSPNAALGLWQPSGVAVDALGNLYIADTYDHRVLRYVQPFLQNIQTPDLVIGQPDLAMRDRNLGAAVPTEFSLAYPVAVDVGPSGELAVSDSGNHRVLL